MDPTILKRIAEGHFAGIALDVLGDLLVALQEETLRRADELRLRRDLSPDIAQAILYELGAYRTIDQRLRQKVRRADSARAASPAANGDGVDAAAEEVEWNDALD